MSYTRRKPISRWVKDLLRREVVVFLPQLGYGPFQILRMGNAFVHRPSFSTIVTTAPVMTLLCQGWAASGSARA